jgi:hypothetical protein
MDQLKQNPYLILVERYIQLLQTVRPDVKPIKAVSSEYLARLSLQHCLWMLNKMKEPDFKPLTSYSGWINWCQSSLYYHGLIEPDYEIDISRDVARQASINHVEGD